MIRQFLIPEKQGPDKCLGSWFRALKQVAFLLLTTGSYFVISEILEVQASRALIKSIRNNGGFIETESILQKNIDRYLPQSLKILFENITYISTDNLSEKTDNFLEVNDDFLEKLSNQRHLGGFRIGSTNNPTTITNRGASYLSKYDLGSLTITGSKISDLGFNELGKTPSLQVLVLIDSKISGEQFQLHSSFKNLKYLEIHGAEINNQGLLQLSYLPKLSWLNLRETILDAKGFCHLPKFKKLDSLYLDNVRLCPSSMTYLSKLKSLRYLNLKGSSINDEVLHHLSISRQIKRLILAESPVTDKGLFHLSQMKNLIRLDLSNTLITDDGLKNLCRLDHLLMLDLENTNVSDRAEEYLLLIPKLFHLNVRGTKLSAATIQSLRCSGIDVESDSPQINGVIKSMVSGTKKWISNPLSKSFSVRTRFFQRQELTKRQRLISTNPDSLNFTPT